MTTQRRIRSDLEESWMLVITGWYPDVEAGNRPLDSDPNEERMRPCFAVGFDMIL